MENFLRMMAIAICLVVVDNAMMAMTTMTTIDEDGYYFVNDFESNVPLTRTEEETAIYVEGQGEWLFLNAFVSTNSSYVKSGTHLLSTGNDKAKLCQEQPIALGESVKEVVASMPANSLSTYILMIDKEATAISDLPQPEDDGPKTYYDLQGRRLDHPHGLCIEKFADGSSRKVYIKD